MPQARRVDRSRQLKETIKLEIEIYNCGCRIRIYEVEYGESKYDLTERPSLITDYSPCRKHRYSRGIPPEEARLIKVQGEHEAFLNE